MRERSSISIYLRVTRTVLYCQFQELLMAECDQVMTDSLCCIMFMVIQRMCLHVAAHSYNLLSASSQSHDSGLHLQSFPKNLKKKKKKQKPAKLDSYHILHFKTIISMFLHEIKPKSCICTKALQAILETISLFPYCSDPMVCKSSSAEEGLLWASFILMRRSWM